MAVFFLKDTCLFFNFTSLVIRSSILGVFDFIPSAVPFVGRLIPLRDVAVSCAFIGRSMPERDGPASPIFSGD